jgi:hypothetical protein
MIEVDAFHITYRQELAACHAIESFLTHFAKAKIYLVVDAGGVIPRCSSNHENIKVTVSSKKITAKSNGLYLDRGTLPIYLGYLFSSLELSTAPYLMILEDDVSIFGSDLGDLPCDLNGINPVERLPLRIRFFASAFTRKNYFSSGYGGCGGSILKKSILTSKSLNQWVEILSRVLRILNRPIGSDELISLMVMLSGGTLGTYSGFAETWEKDIETKFALGVVQVLHKDKSRYV